MKGSVRRYKRGMVATGLLAVAGGLGAAVAHRANAGAVLHTIALPSQGGGITLDMRDHRAVVVGVANGITGYASTIDTASGRLVHIVALGSNPTDVAADAQTGRVFITDIDDGNVRTLDARSGALLRTVAVGDLQPHDLQRLVVDARTNRVFVSTSPLSLPNPRLSAVHMLDARSGAVLHTTMAGGGSLAVDDVTGRVYAADLAASSVSVLDGYTGARVRTLALGAYTRALHIAVDGYTGRVFVATDVGPLQVFDTRSGRLLRTISQPSLRNGLLEVDEARDRVVAADYSAIPPYPADVRLLDARSGAVVRTVTVAGAYAVALDRRWGRVIVGAPNGVSALDVRTGATLWAYAGTIQTLGDIAVDEQTGRVFVVDRGATSPSGAHLDAGSVVVLDGRTGARRSTVTVGVYPGALAIDDSTGHAVVVDDGGLVRVSDSWSWLPSWLRQRLPFFPLPPYTRTVNGSVSLLDAAR